MNLFLPEITLLLTGIIVLGYDLVEIRKNNSKISSWISLAGLSLAAIFVFQNDSGTALGGRFAVEGLDSWFKFIFLASTFFSGRNVIFSFKP